LPDWPGWRWAEKQHLLSLDVLARLEDCPGGALIYYLDSGALPPFIAEAVEKELAFRLEELLSWFDRRNRRAGDGQEKT
jgi:hypothetical protein